MKLKPQIKTHWLASQNPMLIELAGIRRVVFTAPEAYVDFDFKCEASNQIKLPPRSNLQMIPPEADEVRDVNSRSHTLSRDLFWTLFSGHDLLPLKVPPLALRELASSIEFHTDDQIFSLIGFFRYFKVPPFLNPQFYLQDRSCHWERVLGEASDQLMCPLKLMSYQKRHEDFKKTWIMILEILSWSLQRKRQVGDLEVIWAEKAASVHEPRLGYHLDDIEFVKQKPLSATLRSEPQIKNGVKLVIWQGVEQNHKPGIMRLHSVGLINDEIETQHEFIVSPEEENCVQSRRPESKWKALMTTTQVGAKEILNSIQNLEKTIPSENIFYLDHHLIQAEQFAPYLQLRESEGTLQMAVSFSLRSLAWQHLNFPQNLAGLLTVFNGGLETFFGFERKAQASKQIQFRQNDLLFLRHQGLVIFCLLEMINWQLGRSLTSGETLPLAADLNSVEADKAFEKFNNYLKATLPGLLGKSGQKFETLISSEVRELYLDFIEKMYLMLNNDRSVLSTHSGLVEVKNVQSRTLILLRFLLMHLIEESGGKVLMKAQSTIGEKFKASLQNWTQCQIISKDHFAAGFQPLWVDIGVSHRSIINLLFDLLDHGVEIEFNGVPFLSKENPFEFIFSVANSEQKEDSNWFDLHPQIFFNGKRISSDEVTLNFTPAQIGFIEYQGQIYRIDKKQVPTLKSLQKFWNRIKGRREGVKHNTFGDQIYQLEKSEALELLMLKSQGVKIQAEGEWKRIFDYFDNGLGTEKINLPPDMVKSLLPHQAEGAQWLHDLFELKLGAILADEMGLGKTFQVLAFFESLKMRNKLGHCLVVVPTSLVYNWIDEKKKFAPDLPVFVFQSSEKKEALKNLSENKNVIYITTYGLLNENIDFFENQNWNVVAFDEAQNLKNITAIRSVSARKLKSRFKIALTGTPMENHYLEFFSLCDLVVPGCLGDVDTFRKKYYNNEVRSDALRDLRLITKPLLLRRTKQQVKLSLPVKTVQQVVLPFNEQQKDIYKKMAMTFSRQVGDLIQAEGERKAQIAMFAALMRLRQICSDPAAVPGVVFEQRPVKIEHFLNSLQDHIENGESVIVFTQFLTTLSRIEKELKKAEVPFYVLQGSVSSKERIKIISTFQKSTQPAVMLMTLKTGGVGLNLTKASIVYHLEPWWNPAVENQATDRAHRMGQTKDVKVYNLLIEGSLEERIAELKFKKQGSFDRLFSDQEKVDESSFEGSSSLTREDFLYLLK